MISILNIINTKIVGAVVLGLFLSIFSAIFFYESDIFWADEGFVFGFCAIMSVWAFRHSANERLHPLYWRNNAAIGLTRLGVLLSIVWCVYVLAFHADPSIDNPMDTLLYFVMAVAAIKLFGQLGAEAFGPRLRVDVFERKNLAAGTFIGAFTFATGLIFGGAMWGDMLPESLEYGSVFVILQGYEDGWWITPWFFLMGWTVLIVSLILWLWSERSSFRYRVVKDHSLADAQAAAYFCVAVGITVAFAVQGDYHGIRHSLFSFSFVALPVVAHGAMRPRSGQYKNRHVEGMVYIALALISVVLTPHFARFLGFEL